MSRVQLALNVDDIDEAVDFYTALFGVRPAKLRPGYANFAIAEPPLKLVLIENAGSGGSLNHLGVEHPDVDGVAEAAERLQTAGLTIEREDDVVCCYARQSKHWATGPNGEKWENYVVLADAGAEMEGKTLADVPATTTSGAAQACPDTDGKCCASAQRAA